MTLSDDTGQDAPYAHDRYRTRNGRHGRPGPFGGRLRLPTLRFSGAAMAMSTVVGISIATTFLLNEQQGVGRRAGTARVGSSGPPTPATSPDAGSATGTGTTSGTGTAAGPDTSGPDTKAGRRPAGPASSGTRAPDAVPAQRTSSPPVPRTGGAPSTAPLAEGPASRHGVTGGPATEQSGATGAPETLAGGRPEHPQSADEQFAPAGTGAQTARRPAEDPSPSGASPSPSPSVPAPSPTTPRPFVPAPDTPGVPVPSPRDWTGGTLGTTDDDGADDTGSNRPGATADEADDQALGGTALVQSLGRDGTRHVLALTVTEPLTALQAEFRLAPGAAVPGSGTAWTDLAGAVVTTHQERGAAVYRFSTPPGTDVRPGRYTFTVRGTRPAGHATRPAAAAPPRAAVRRGTPESWSAGAFGIARPRAVSTLGGFATPAPRAAAPAG
ncbi:hypothetical protein [Kitasatospora purpeofusca]|uniref:hypothetical protein n=1 Tax=Kitasatospora purpeofusca TaxID=67352 RepID=UPI0036D2B638